MNYLFIGKCDVDFIVKILNEESDKIWLEHTFRQNEYAAHRDTNTIEILWDKNSLFTGRVGNKHEVNYNKFKIELFLDSIKPLYEKIYGKGFFIRALLVKLPAKTKIEPHKDVHYGLEECKRTHIPLITNEKVKFIVDDEEKYMKVGEIWEINNQNVHSVINDSDHDRIHFIIDYKQQNKLF